MVKYELFLAGCLLIGCAHSANHDPSIAEGAAEKQLPMRVIVSFSDLSLTDKEQVLATISETCHCSPIFIRAYADSALIYEIALSQSQSYASFEKALLMNGMLLGIQAVDRDVPMQYQQ